MKKIWDKIVAFFKSTDKQLHMLAGFSVSALLYILISASQPWWVGVLIGAAIASVIVVMKEIYDKQNPDKHTFEVADIIAGELGVLVLILASLVNLG